MVDCVRGLRAPVREQRCLTARRDVARCVTRRSDGAVRSWRQARVAHWEDRVSSARAGDCAAGRVCVGRRGSRPWSDARPKEAHRDQNLPLPDPSPTCLHANGPSPRARRVRRNLSGGSLAVRARRDGGERARLSSRHSALARHRGGSMTRPSTQIVDPARVSAATVPPSATRRRRRVLSSVQREVRASVARDAAQQLHMAAGCRLLHATAGLCTCSERAHGIVSVAYVQ